jgi:hypothetical protein
MPCFALTVVFAAALGQGTIAMIIASRIDLMIAFLSLAVSQLLLDPIAFA